MDKKTYDDLTSDMDTDVKAANIIMTRFNYNTITLEQIQRLFDTQSCQKMIEPMFQKTNAEQVLSRMKTIPEFYNNQENFPFLGDIILHVIWAHQQYLNHYETNIEFGTPFIPFENINPDGTPCIPTPEMLENL
jgi:hypothetical protein